MAKQRVHNEYFRKVCIRSVYGPKIRDETTIYNILHRPDNTMTYEDLKRPYTSFLRYESSRKSCPTCGEKLLPDEWIWSWGEYVSGKWRTVKHFCKSCYPEIQRDLEVHREDCGCEFALIGYQGEQLPKWLTLPSR